jgi:hypothetical protein
MLMRKTLPLVLVVLLAAVAAEAQETYSVGPASAAQVTTLTTVISALNRETCLRYSLAASCTQAQACAAAGATGGSGCSAAQARAAGVRIWPATFAGREEFTTHGIAVPGFNALVSAQNNETRRIFCDGWTAATVTQRNNACTAIGLSAGCDPVCP